MKHTIAAVPYQHGQPGDDATLTCVCAWQGRAGDFAAHRREAATSARDVRNTGGALGPGTGASWVRLNRHEEGTA